MTLSGRKTLAFLAAAAFLFSHSGVAHAQAVTLTLPQAQAMARAAIDQGRPELAYSLSDGLLQADPRNGYAYYIRALALASVRDYGESRKAARRAYRFSATNLQRHEAANLAARIAFEDERFTLSQLWLRRAVQYAPDDVTRAQTANDFRRVRARNPLNFRLSFSVTPSDNVNNGANSPVNLIDGVPVVGTLSPSAQALSGVITRAELRASYRLAQSERYETRLTGRANRRQVSLNDPVAGISGGDLSSSTLELGLSQFLTSGGSPDSYWRLDATAGRVWYGGDLLYNSYELAAQRRQNLSEGLFLTFGGSAERQIDEAPPLSNSTVLSAFASVSYTIAGGGKLGAYIRYSDTENRAINRDFSQWTGVLSFQPGRPVGPAELNLTLGYSASDYPIYAVGFPIPGGREDTSVFGGVTATFNDWSYMGFVPTVSVRSQKSRSNVSRFDVDETSVSMGIRSEF